MGAVEAVISIVGVWVGGNHTFKVSKKQGQGVGFPMLLSSHPIPLPWPVSKNVSYENSSETRTKVRTKLVRNSYENSYETRTKRVRNCRFSSYETVRNSYETRTKLVRNSYELSVKMCCSASMLCRPSTMSLQVRNMLSIP